jgi:hypothetical protein
MVAAGLKYYQLMDIEARPPTSLLAVDVAAPRDRPILLR